MARPRLLDATERTCVRRDRDGAEYRGRFVSDWDIGSVPNGGYSLGTVVHCAKDFVDGLVAEDEASGASSSATSNYCLLHAGAAYLVAVTSTKDWHVEVRLEKKGRSYIYLDCTLKQAVSIKPKTLFCDMSLIVLEYSSCSHGKPAKPLSSPVSAST